MKKYLDLQIEVLKLGDRDIMFELGDSPDSELPLIPTDSGKDE